MFYPRRMLTINISLMEISEQGFFIISEVKVNQCHYFAGMDPHTRALSKICAICLQTVGDRLHSILEDQDILWGIYQNLPIAEASNICHSCHLELTSVQKRKRKWKKLYREIPHRLPALLPSYEHLPEACLICAAFRFYL